MGNCLWRSRGEVNDTGWSSNDCQIISIVERWWHPGVAEIYTFQIGEIENGDKKLRIQQWTKKEDQHNKGTRYKLPGIDQKYY